MTPWGYTDEPVPDINVLEIGEKAADAIAVKYRTTYEVGTPANVLSYMASGGSFDWVKGRVNVTYSYALELRYNGQYGFLLPIEQIQDTVEETWDGVKAIHRRGDVGRCQGHAL